VIEAVQYTGKNGAEIMAFAGLKALCTVIPELSGPRYLVVETPAGMVRASPGDWIIKGVKGEFYPCKPDIFEETYEAVEEDAEGFAPCPACGCNIREGAELCPMCGSDLTVKESPEEE
jgi:hypothetical protein